MVKSGRNFQIQSPSKLKNIETAKDSRPREARLSGAVILHAKKWYGACPFHDVIMIIPVYFQVRFRGWTIPSVPAAIRHDTDQIHDTHHMHGFVGK